jgi:alanine racemase
MSRPLIATIYPSALAANLRLARERARGARVLAVVKANAYGHGVARVLRGLVEADGLALLELDAAVRLREQGYTGSILLLEGCFAPNELAEAAAHDLALVVHHAEQIARITQFPPDALRKPFAVFVKLNTGMNRLGFPAEEAAAVVSRIEATGKARVACVMTHFARADEPDGIAEPCARFERACAAWPRERYARSLANSAALLRHGALGGDFVRPGIMLYGASPFATGTGFDLGLQAAMSLQSELIAVQDLRAGERVGYGGTFVAPAAMRIGVVACGYADGYPRHAPHGTPVLVGGQRVPLAGRVSMDMFTVDLTAVPQARAGSPVELWGRQLAVDEVAQAAGTIGYELLCAVAPRVAMQVAEGDREFNGLGLGVEACI